MISYLLACFYEDQTRTYLTQLLGYLLKKPCESITLKAYFPEEKPYSYCFEDPSLKEERCFHFYPEEEESVIKNILERFNYKGCLNKKNNPFQAAFNRGCLYEKKEDFLLISYQRIQHKIFLKKNYFPFFYRKKHRLNLLNKLQKTPLYVHNLPMLKKYLETRIVHGALCENYLTNFSTQTVNECEVSYFIVDSTDHFKIKLKLSSMKESKEVDFENLFMAVKKLNQVFNLGSLWTFEAWTSK